MKKKIILLASVVALLSACGGSGNGELIGVQKRQIWNPTDPYGMVFIPQGSYTMGPSDQDVPFANVSQSKQFQLEHFIWTKPKLQTMSIVSLPTGLETLAHVILGEAGIEGHLIEEDEYGTFLNQQ